MLLVLFYMQLQQPTPQRFPPGVIYMVSIYRKLPIKQLRTDCPFVCSERARRQISPPFFAVLRIAEFWQHLT